MLELYFPLSLKSKIDDQPQLILFLQLQHLKNLVDISGWAAKDSHPPKINI